MYVIQLGPELLHFIEIRNHRHLPTYQLITLGKYFYNNIHKKFNFIKLIVYKYLNIVFSISDNTKHDRSETFF